MAGIMKIKKHVKKVKGEKNFKQSEINKKQYFHSAIFPLGFFKDDFFVIAIKETTRGFLEEN